MDTIYIEQDLLQHPITQRVLQGIGKKATVIECQHYREVFNRKAQNFRLQKQNPALILAQKNGRLVLPTPPGFGIGGAYNYYFSHMLNCVYDCRYCFLQGLYQSANYVFFINYPDFMQQIDAILAQHPQQQVYFFSGYDCDSLVYESVTQFIRHFLPFFAERPDACLELRTKSTTIQPLLKLSPINNCVVAYSLTPERIAAAVEHKAPPVGRRLAALRSLVQAGWSVGIRLDPLIYADDFQEQYQQLITQIFEYIPASALHSVSIGPLRFPEKMYRRIVKLYPQDKLLAHPLYKRDQHFSYYQEVELTMKQFVSHALSAYIDKALLFECSPL